MNIITWLFSLIMIISAILIAIGIVALKNHRKSPISSKVFFAAIAAFVIAFGINFSIASKGSSDETSQHEKTEKNVTKETKSKNKSQSTSNDVFTKSNKKIAASLKEDQGFANGTLDKDGNPTDSGTPNEDFNWSLYIKSINYAKDKSFEIKVIDDFDTLSADDKKTVINSAQNSALAAISEITDVSTETYQRGLFTTISIGNTDIGHSKISNYKDFKWPNN